MATLEEDVKARFGNQYLVNLTNPYDGSPDVIDETRLTKAADDVKGEFEKKGIEYDDTSAMHVTTGVEGVEILLLYRTGAEPRGKWDRWRDDVLQDLALVTSRDRLLPVTDSVREPSQEKPGKLQFDDQRFLPLIPGSPTPSDDEEADLEN